MANGPIIRYEGGLPSRPISTSLGILQLGIQFVQVGNSEHAKAWLQKLDDDSKSVIDGRRSSLFARDIIDTRPFDGQQLTPKLLLEVLCGAIHRQTDREGADHWLDEAPIKTDWHSKKGPKEC